jgi:hypothetical protein
VMLASLFANRFASLVLKFFQFVFLGFLKGLAGIWSANSSKCIA